MLAYQPNLRSASMSLETDSKQLVEAGLFGPNFLRPAYDSFCFANLPGFIESTILGKTARANLPSAVTAALGLYDHVVFIFFDAFGWESFERFRGSEELFKTIDRNGLTMESTAQFPSTTAVHVTTEITGQPFYQHGICGWDYFEPRVGRMIKPLRFAFSEDSDPDTLSKAGHTPERVLPQGQFMSELKDAGVTVRRYGPAACFPSPFSSAYTDSDCVHGYTDFSAGIQQAVTDLSNIKTKSYQYIYVDLYDTACHHHGVGSNEADKVALDIIGEIYKLIKSPWMPKTLLVLSADHGHMATQSDKAIAINEVLPNLHTMLKLDTNNHPIRFSGARRHLFLHPKPECQAELTTLLTEKLDGAATVMNLEQLSSAGLLGPKSISNTVAERLGQIAILPHEGFSVYWNEPPLFEFGPLSSHGGASRQEMETPLLMMPFGR
jgi:hypothetical protein